MNHRLKSRKPVYLTTYNQTRQKPIYRPGRMETNMAKF